MRLLVFSDSHGQTYYMRKALLKHPEADMIIYLGDGEDDLENLSFEINNRPVVKVRGNCDFYSSLNYREVLELEGHIIYCTHGYTEHVKYGTYDLEATASGYNADIILFGHTHEQMSDYEDGVYLMNPGTANDGYYGMIDLLPQGVMINTARI